VLQQGGTKSMTGKRSGRDGSGEDKSFFFLVENLFYKTQIKRKMLFCLEIKQSKMEDFFKDAENFFRSTYKEKAEALLNEIDLKKLAEIKSKPLMDLTDEELKIIGLEKIENDEYEHFYYCKNCDALKIYFNKVEDKFEMRGYRLRKHKDILTTSELIEEAVIKWQLRYDVN